MALDAFRGDLDIAELASKYEIHPTLVTKWKKHAVEGLSMILPSIYAVEDRAPRVYPWGNEPFPSSPARPGVVGDGGSA